MARRQLLLVLCVPKDAGSSGKYLRLLPLNPHPQEILEPIVPAQLLEAADVSINNKSRILNIA